METIDWKATYRAHYSPTTKAPEVIDVPAMNFLMVDGRGNPNTSEDYRQTLEALYSLAYTLKFALKKAGRADFRVMPLEGLWWAEDMDDFIRMNKDAWSWTMMIAQPEPVGGADVAAAIEAVRQKRAPALLERVRFERFMEGCCAQILYLGPYSDEGPTIQRLHAFIADAGYVLRGRHHEIYLGDPRRSAPEKLKTIIRQPVG